MAHIPQEYFRQFFGELVGTPEATARFRADLSAAVLAAEPPADGRDTVDDPYVRLAYAAAMAVDRVVAGKLEDEDVAGEAGQGWGRIWKNGIFGVQTIMSAVRTVGDLYESKARRPQTESNVRRNVGRALGYIMAIAQNGGMAGVHNLVAAELGLNPTDPRHLREIQMTEEIYTQLKREGISLSPSVEKAFKVTGRWRWGGQLVIRPRFPLLRGERGRRCPASVPRMAGSEGTKERGLAVMMEVIGDVAVTDIFSRSSRFEIIPD